MQLTIFYRLLIIVIDYLIFLRALRGEPIFSENYFQTGFTRFTQIFSSTTKARRYTKVHEVLNKILLFNIYLFFVVLRAFVVNPKPC